MTPDTTPTAPGAPVSSEALLADVLSYIADQAKQFRQCARHHAEHNRGAEAVAIRAAEVLDRTACDIRAANAPDQARVLPSPEAGCSPVWVQPPDCPRCGQPLKAIKHTHGQWTCGNHVDDGKCLWFDWELTMILRARLDQANAHADGSAVADTVRRDVGTLNREV